MKIREYPRAVELKDTDAFVVETASGTMYVENKDVGNNGLAAHPIGSLYLSMDSTSPASMFGGEWEQLKNVFLRAADDTNKGGSSTHAHWAMNGTLDTDSYMYMTNLASSDSRSRTRTVMSARVKNADSKANRATAEVKVQAEEWLPPYQNIYVWRRVA